MARTKKVEEPLSQQVKNKVKRSKEEVAESGNNVCDFSTVISTGSTLLDLAISGGRVRGGGLCGGIFVEIFGPNGSGKTVLLCEIAGDVQRKGGSVRFDDPEARLNTQFASMFDLNTDDIDYSAPDTVTQVFENIRSWEPSTPKKINGTFTDSLAALSTNIEMENDEGDKMGMRRAKEFSEGLRKNARILANKNYLMVCSNQIREKADAGSYGKKTESPGGKAIGFYASVRLEVDSPEKIWVEKTLKKGKKVKKVIGIKSTVNVFKNSLDKPYRSAPVYIIFDYGVDDIRANLQYVKEYKGLSTYSVNGEAIDNSMEVAIKYVEENDLVEVLKEEVIDLWESIEAKFETTRKPKKR